MGTKSWRINRRTLLQGGGAAIALPWLDAMAWAKDGEALAAKKRFCAIYFPFGAPNPSPGHPMEKWSWLPKDGNDGSYEFREILKPLTDLKSHVTVIRGLSHGRDMGGHNSGDGFLTGTPVSGGQHKNTISVDQIVAEKYGSETRFSSLVLGIDGGIGRAGQASTLSFGRDGAPIAAQSNVRRLFDSMFSAATRKELAADLKRKGSILDRLLESSKELSGKIGTRDQVKLDEYLSSIRDLEMRIQKQEAWLSKDSPNVDASTLSVGATLEEPADYLKSMFDLIFLALQADMTRSVTFQIGNQDANAASAKLAGRLVGSSHHNLAHRMNKDDGPAKYGSYLQHLTGLYAGFLDRLKSTKDGAGTMLDNTLSLFGSSNGYATHSSKDLPLIVGGGEGLGIKQGQYLKLGSQVRLTNLYATMLDKLGAPVGRFADSNGFTSELVKR